MRHLQLALELKNQQLCASLERFQRQICNLRQRTKERQCLQEYPDPRQSSQRLTRCETIAWPWHLRYLTNEVN